MSTLKGIFGNPKPKIRRNFIQENVRQLREMQEFWRNKDEHINSAAGRLKGSKFQNVSAKVPPHVTGSQPKSNEPNARDAVRTRAVRRSNSLSRTLEDGQSSQIRHVKQKGHAKGNSTASKRNNHENKDMDSDVTKRTDVSHCMRHHQSRDRPSSTELSFDMSEMSSNPSDRSPESRSMGCQTVDPKNWDKVFNEGVIKYPSSRQLPKSKTRLSGRGPPTREMGLQTDRVPSPTAAAGDTPTSNDSNEPDIQKLTLDELKESSADVCEPQSSKVNYVKMNAKSLTTRQRSPTQATDPLKAPPSYQRGVIPRYLRERQEEWQKEAEQRVLDTPDSSCPSGHVPLPDSERRETLKMLRKSYADLIQELNMMPVRTDTLRMRHRKMELEKQLNKIEEGIKVFSRPKVFVKIGA
ncbi:uncharacterized protein [Periplaneta americana]